jgi:hypothetical protein
MRELRNVGAVGAGELEKTTLRMLGTDGAAKVEATSRLKSPCVSAPASARRFLPDL